MYLNWWKGSLLLGFVFVLAFIVMKPIGVSTEYVVLDGIYEYKQHPNLITKDAKSKTGYRSSNAYLDKFEGKLAEHIIHPKYYGMIFVVSILLGGLIGRLTSKEASKAMKQIPQFHSTTFKNSVPLHYILVFMGGVLMLVGARLAGGCTSGHMMSGMMQTSLSGYVFAFVVFAVAVPISILIYKTKEN